MPTNERATPVTLREANALFAGLSQSSGLVLAVSGGPDSTALLWLAARWHRALKAKGRPPLLALTVDHDLRAESAREARDVAKLAKSLGVPHKTMRWTGRKPATGLPQAARIARYAMLTQAARAIGASHVLTAHTRDDQAETVLIRMARGSGMTGLGAMAALTPLPPLPKGGADRQVLLARPFLNVPKERLIATLRAARIPFADDPTNRDPRFTRPRIRELLAGLEREGLDAARLSALARRLRRADEAIEIAVDAAQAAVSRPPAHDGLRVELDAALFDRLPPEIALRLLGRAVSACGDEGPVELGKLEALLDALAARTGAFRRTLAGAMVTCRSGRIVVETAPPRRSRVDLPRKRPLTTRAGARTTRRESR
jgi:tRNA(Ile)-lysidine synthase